MSNNLYFQFNCPPNMNDTRFMTEYHPKDTLEDFYESVLQSTSEHDYRKKLQNNGEKIMAGTLYFQLKNNTCSCASAPCKI